MSTAAIPAADLGIEDLTIPPVHGAEFGDHSDEGSRHEDSTAPPVDRARMPREHPERENAIHFTVDLPSQPAAALDEVWHRLIIREHQQETAARIRASLDDYLTTPYLSEAWVNAVREAASKGLFKDLAKDLLRDIIVEVAMALARAAIGVPIPIPPTNLISAFFTAADLGHYFLS